MAITVIGSVELENSDAKGVDGSLTVGSVAVDALTDGMGVVTVGIASGSTFVISGVTWNGVSMTRAVEAIHSASDLVTEMWYVLESDGTIDDGTYDIVITFSSPAGTAGNSTRVGVEWFSGVDQTAPLDDISEYDNQTSATVNDVVVTPSEGGEFCAAVTVNKANGITSVSDSAFGGTLATTSWDSGGNGCCTNYDIPVGSGDKTLTHTYTQTQPWCGCGATFKEAGGAAPSTDNSVLKMMGMGD